MGYNPTTLAGIPLTTREREAVILTCWGYTAHQVAEKMEISKITVRQYIHSARIKYGARNVAQLAAQFVSASGMTVESCHFKHNV